ncbi:MAG: MBL fold metallo-hydrolase, partial [Anaerolineae bacterium]|nr:MBL fold metallo-hydrolase [Anaerolineae bacterium]
VDLGNGTLIFDTLLTPRAAEALRATAVELTGKPIRWVVNSHYHNDHIRGNQVFVQEAAILTTAQTRALITSAGVEELDADTAHAANNAANLKQALAEATSPAEQARITFWLDYYRAIAESLDTLVLTLPNITFERELHLHGPHRTVVLRGDGGGHTASDAVLIVPDARVAFLGDLLFVACHPFLADGNPLTWLATLKQLQSLDVDVFVPGHGPVGTRADLAAMIDYLETCIARSQTLVQAGRTADEAAADAIPAQFADWLFPQFFASNMRFLHSFVSTQEKP